MEFNLEEGERKFFGDGWFFKGELKDLKMFLNGGNGI